MKLAKICPCDEKYSFAVTRLNNLDEHSLRNKDASTHIASTILKYVDVGHIPGIPFTGMD